MPETIEELSEILVSKVRAYNRDFDEALLRKALAFGTKAHAPQKRQSGEPYFTHPINVAIILTDMKLNLDGIITALLHDTVEDTDVTLEDLEREFNPEVAKLVDGVTKLTKLELKSETESSKQAENFRKLLVAMSEDIRVLLVKLADRLHNMRTLGHMKPEKQKRIAQETMDIYATLAERIGMHQFKDELQDLSFQILHPDVRESVINRLKFLREKGEAGVKRTLTELKQKLAEAGIKADITGREKKPCSIWNKMQRKNISFEQLADIIAFRVFVETTAECYHVLGILHSNYHVVPDRFRDFISTPKSNGYQSLHTTIIGPEKQPIEIQIRTYEMHEIAEMGVASHWSYKQGRDMGMEGKQYRWVRELLDILSHSTNPEEFLENTRLEMYHDQVFCFSPKGDLIALPKGATPVDFAFAVHSDVGFTCVGAKVNGRIVPLRHQIENGDQIEIIRSKTQTPSPTWERFVVTGKARAEVRKFVRAQQREEYVRLGKSILTKHFKEAGYDLNDNDLLPALKKLGKKEYDDIYADVGEGILSRNTVLDDCHPEHSEKSQKKKKTFFFFSSSKDKKEKKTAIPIRGLIPGMAVHFAACCHPLPGDKIVGIITTGKGVTIHTSDCDTLENFSETPERWVEVEWDDTGVDQHIGRLKIILSHEPGALAALTNIIAKENGNITNLKIINRSSDFFEMMVDVGVKSLSHLNSIMAALRSKQAIHSVERFGV
jgi:guanosine-3',5'-bis(diphosphate) 3'-pyrophosphohydrolase